MVESQGSDEVIRSLNVGDIAEIRQVGVSELKRAFTLSPFLIKLLPSWIGQNQQEFQLWYDSLDPETEKPVIGNLCKGVEKYTSFFKIIDGKVTLSHSWKDPQDIRYPTDLQTKVDAVLQDVSKEYDPQVFYGAVVNSVSGYRNPRSGKPEIFVQTADFYRFDELETRWARSAQPIKWNSFQHVDTSTHEAYYFEFAVAKSSMQQLQSHVKDSIKALSNSGKDEVIVRALNMRRKNVLQRLEERLQTFDPTHQQLGTLLMNASHALPSPKTGHYATFELIDGKPCLKEFLKVENQGKLDMHEDDLWFALPYNRGEQIYHSFELTRDAISLFGKPASVKLKRESKNRALPFELVYL